MYDVAKKRLDSRLARHLRIRKKVIGTAERPRLAVRRTLKNMVAQLIDDVKHLSILQFYTGSKEFQGEFGELTKTEQARKLGAKLAEAAKAKGIETIVFDRGGYIYHGRVQALAESVREGGIKF